MARQGNTLEDNLLFKPGIIRNKSPAAPVRNLSLADVDSSDLSTTGSFRYDSPGAALKSTQQLFVDWSDFSTHTFFNSAEAKVQKSFDKIINRFPFDGSKTEVVSFIDELSGFEKYVLDQFPKHTGYLAFSGSSSPSNPGTFLSINDFQGSYSPILSKKKSGKPILDPGLNPFTLEFYINIPSGTANASQVVAQKLSGSNGISLVLSASAAKASPLGTVDFLVMVSSGSLALSASMELTKGEFAHCASVFDRATGPGQIRLYKNSVEITSSSLGELGEIDFKSSPMIIGSGTSHNLGFYNFEPSETFSGSLDELRFWHAARLQQEIHTNRFGDVFSQNDLKLLYRFNEPSGSFASSAGDLALDHSGNGLHTVIQNFDMSLRNTGTYGTPPVAAENELYSPVLFPSFSTVTSLNTTLLVSASNYDYSNPNLVTRLVPPHYLKEASGQEGFETEKGDIGDEIATRYDQPGGAHVGQPQIIAGLLYTFAESFDELKMFVDEFKRLLKVDVLTTNVISDQLLPWLSRYYGISLPNFYSAASLDQILDGRNIRRDRLNTTALQTVQNTLWRRIFSDLPFILSTRGTHNSIKSILANIGISPSGPIRVRELGGSKRRILGDSFVKRHEIASMLDMSGTYSAQGTLSSQGIDSNRPFLQGTYLSGSRVEPGRPNIAGTFVSGVSNTPSDGLYTSGSWTIEGIYKFNPRISHFVTQSLLRLHVTGTDAASSNHGALFNLLAIKPNVQTSETGSVILAGRPMSGSTASTLSLILTGVDVFDGDKWQFSFGRTRNDLTSSYISSSYFLRAGKTLPGGFQELLKTSAYFDDQTNSALQSISGYNTSGSFITIGSQSLDTTTNNFLNSPSASNLHKSTEFSGKVSTLRFWSKALTEDESKSHIRNFKSLGVLDPEVNFGFTTSASGSFERMRQDVSIDQPITKSDASGNISFFDFSQNGLTIAGTGFEASKQVIVPERFDFEVLSSKFQAGENPNKIRVRSFLDDETAEKFNVSKAPLYQINQAEEPKDDKRVLIELSLVQALNEDIMNIFSSLEALDNIIGSPELVFSQEYPSLRNLRRIYFNRLTDKINFQSFFEFFKWFDDMTGDLIEQMLPSDSKSLGSSYVIESHALERPKFVYNYYDVYLNEANRGGKEAILMQLLVGTLRKI